MEAIFLPGIGASDRDFPEYRRIFSKLTIIRYQGCITLEDHLSRIDETVMKLEEEGQAYVLIGHSLGANLAHYYITHRNLTYIQGYTMIGGGPRFHPLKSWKTIFSLPNWGIGVVLFLIAFGAPFLFLAYGWHGMYQRINVIDLFIREGIDPIRRVYNQTLEPLENDPHQLNQDIPVQIIRLPNDLLFSEEAMQETKELIPQIDETLIDRDIIHFTHNLDVLVVAHIHNWLKTHEMETIEELPFDMLYALENPDSIKVEIEGFSIPRPPLLLILAIIILLGINNTFPESWISIISRNYFISVSELLAIQEVDYYWYFVLPPLLVLLLLGYKWIITPIFPSEKQFKLGEYPFVSIIVPMRNEARNIEMCLRSLLQLNYPAYEIIISDGNSEDDSIDVAETTISKFNTMNVPCRILTEDPLPDDWVGKSWGCWNAVNHASGDYYLFTDADTYHHRDSLRNTIRVLNDRDLQGLSVVGKFVTNSFWERAILPFFKSLLFIIFGGRFSNKIGRTLAIGQYILVDASTYHEFDGHKSIKSEIAEDIHLASSIRENGDFESYNGNEIYSVRMYQSYQEIKQGLSRNAVESIGGNFVLAILAIIGLVTWRIGPFFLYFLGRLYYPGIVSLILLSFAIFTLGLYWVDVKINNDPLWFVLLVPFGVINLCYFLLLASIPSKGNQTRLWKGRKYQF